MALPEEVRYSILRNNIEVPLIPIDQLPFKLKDLPFRLESVRHGGQGWKLIGRTQQPALLLSTQPRADLQSSHLQGVSSTKMTPLAPDHTVRKKSATESPTGATMRNQPAEVYFPNKRAPNPSGIEPDPSKKEYCTHWIRHNSCDYMQQGCRYKHEMPDREKLKELGFPQIPSWYRDKMAISAGASSWIRPRTEKSGNERPLSTEPSASRDIHMFTSQHRQRQPGVAERPRLPSPKSEEISLDIPDLIDLDDLTFEKQSTIPPMVESPVPAATPGDEHVIDIDTSFVEKHCDTFVASPGQEMASPMSCADVPTCVGPACTTPAPKSSMSSLPSNQLERGTIVEVDRQVSENTSRQVTKAKNGGGHTSKSSAGARREHTAKQSKPHGRLPSRSWRSSVPVVSATSPNISISESARAQDPCKSTWQCRNSGIRADLKSKATSVKRADHRRTQYT